MPFLHTYEYMATAYQNLSFYDSGTGLHSPLLRIAIVCAEWNADITEKLLEGVCNTLERHGVKDDNIFVEHVPGTFELTFGAQRMAMHYRPDAVIVLGCVIQGDTPHFDYVCEGVTEGITRLNATLDIPVIFGVLTTNNKQQALDRAGGKYGNKGDEAAVTAIKMAAFAARMK